MTAGLANSSTSHETSTSLQIGQLDRQRALLVLADQGKMMLPELIDIYALIDLQNEDQNMFAAPVEVGYGEKGAL